MSFNRTAIAAVLLSASLLSGCSGDDSSDEPDPSTASGGTAASDKATTKERPNKQRTCKTEVEVTGTAEASFNGKGTSRTGNSGPAAVYSAENGDARISAYADGDDIKKSVNVTVGDATFTTQQGDTAGLDIKGNGKSATVDVDAYGIGKNAQVHITASFDC